MKISELRQNSIEELRNILNKLYLEQFNLKMQRGTGQLIRHDQVKRVRRSVARVKTVVKETIGI